MMKFYADVREHIPVLVCRLVGLWGAVRGVPNILGLWGNIEPKMGEENGDRNSTGPNLFVSDRLMRKRGVETKEL